MPGRKDVLFNRRDGHDGYESLARSVLKPTINGGPVKKRLKRSGDDLEPGYIVVQPRIRLNPHDGEIQVRGKTSSSFSEKEPEELLNSFMDELNGRAEQFGKRLPKRLPYPTRWSRVVRHMQRYSRTPPFRWSFSFYKE